MNKKLIFLASAVGISVFMAACEPAAETPTNAPPATTPAPATPVTPVTPVTPATP
ncbi:MAG: beta-Ig-H3/fasciclin [Nostoc desertorum CM1-VF14]|nr:beta-Ig-H3/fasciclin [Nostoc desertorum CM1-VF14]